NDTRDVLPEKVHRDEAVTHWSHPAQQFAIATAAVFDPVPGHVKQLNRHDLPVRRLQPTDGRKMAG
ncbi:MAG TPA: hypothetical protein VGM77_00860, partial [Gemmatimonadales bacterium]